MKKLFTLLAVVLGVVGLSVGQTFAEEAVNVGNKICPISGEGFSHGDPVTVEYKGKIYNLCCGMCKKDFLKDPEKAIQALKDKGEIK